MNPLAKHGHTWYRSRLALPGPVPYMVKPLSNFITSLAPTTPRTWL